LLFVPFGLGDPGKLLRSRRAQLRRGIDFRLAEVDRIELAADTVHLADGDMLEYDVLVIASGASLLPEETDGLTGPGWRQRMFTFYTLDGAIELRNALRSFDSGRLVVNMVDLPVKCPVAPLEFCFLADWYFRRRGVRDRIELGYVTSLDGAFTRATCNRELSVLLDRKGIEVTTEFNTGQVDGEAGKLVSWDDRELLFDVLVGFKWVYWHMLLPGRTMPGISAQMQLAGKDTSVIQNLEGAPR
jgi:sulfide:quinone oxidoreductase